MNFGIFLGSQGALMNILYTAKERQIYVKQGPSGTKPWPGSQFEQ